MWQAQASLKALVTTLTKGLTSLLSILGAGQRHKPAVDSTAPDAIVLQLYNPALATSAFAKGEVRVGVCGPVCI